MVDEPVPKGGFSLQQLFLSGLVTAVFGVGGAALVVWKNDTLRENQIAYLIKSEDRKERQIDALNQEVSNQRGEINSLKNNFASYQAAAMDKIDTLLERDRFRRNR